MADIKLLYAHRIKPDKLLQLPTYMLNSTTFIRIGMLKLYKFPMLNYLETKAFVINKDYEKKQVISFDEYGTRKAQPILVSWNNLHRLFCFGIYALRKCDD